MKRMWLFTISLLLVIKIHSNCLSGFTGDDFLIVDRWTLDGQTTDDGCKEIT